MYINQVTAIFGTAPDCSGCQLQSTLYLQTPCYCEHPIMRTAAKSKAKIEYRRLIEINFHYYGLSLLRTLTRSPEGVRNKES